MGRRPRSPSQPTRAAARPAEHGTPCGNLWRLERRSRTKSSPARCDRFRTDPQYAGADAAGQLPSNAAVRLSGLRCVASAQALRHRTIGLGDYLEQVAVGRIEIDASAAVIM